MSTSTLQGLPPLPKSLQTLLCAGVAQWREMEKTHQLRTLIQQQLAAENGTNGISVGPRSNGEQTQDSDDASPVEMPVRPAVSSSCYPSGSASRGIEAAISHLHQEMVRNSSIFVCPFRLTPSFVSTQVFGLCKPVTHFMKPPPQSTGWLKFDPPPPELFRTLELTSHPNGHMIFTPLLLAYPEVM